MTETQNREGAGVSSEAPAPSVCARCKINPRDRKGSSYCRDCRNAHAAEYRLHARPRPRYEDRACELPDCSEVFTWCSMRPKQLYCSKSHYMKAREAAKRALRTPPEGFLSCSKCGQTKPRSAFPPSRQHVKYRAQCSDCGTAYSREWDAANKERRSAATRRSRAARLLRKYGAPSDDIDRLAVQQNGLCYLCGEPPVAGKGFHIDHDHTVGEERSYRGLACNGCNLGIGAFGDDVEKMLRVAIALEAKHSELLTSTPATSDM